MTLQSRYGSLRGAARCGPHRARAAGGFTVSEVLVSLVILALLLAAITVATHGVMHSYGENAKIAEVTQAARVVLQRLVREVRTADAIDSGSHEIGIIPPPNDDGLTQIVYELSDGALRCSRTVDGSTVTRDFISSDGSVRVESFNISRETDVDDEGLTYTKSLTAVLGLRVGENTFEVTASACPRRNLEY